MNNTPVMPRRRGSLHNSSTRRAAICEDARNGGKSGAVKGNRKSSMTNHKEAVTTDVATTPAPLSAANKSGAMAAAGVALMTNHVTGVDSPATNPPDGTDSGYLHKKFKKVAAAVMRDEPESGINPAGRTPPPVICSSTSSASQVAPESTPMVQNESRQTTAMTGAANLPANQKALDNGPSVGADVTTPSAAGGTGRTKSGRYVCPYCQHACAKPSVLEKHIRAHTNERPYPCVPCGFAFKTKSNLYKHCKSRTHVLKVEESGGADPAAAQSTDAGSDTSDDMSNMNEGQDSDDVDGADAPTASASGNNNNISSNNNNVPLTDAVQNGLAESSTTPEKFKTPYKPKFHVFKPSEDGAPLAPGTVPVSTEERSDANSVNCDSAHFGASSGTSSGAACRPQLASLQARISQIISENQAIVETKDPIWPRRYVRQSSRDKDSNYAASGPNNKIKVSGPTGDVAASALTSPPAVIHQRISLNRERSSSLSLVDPASLDLSRSALTVSARSLGPAGSPSRSQTFSPNHAPPAPSGVTFTPKLIHHVEAEEMHRKRCYSEGPENAMRHSVRHILQPIPALSSQTKVARSEPASAPVDAGNPTIRPESYPSALAHPTSLHPQNPEGSIIKDLLLKSRGLLGSGDAKEADVPAKVTSSSSSSFSVSALLNSATSARSSSFSYQQMAVEASRSAPEMDEAEGSDERPSKKAKLSPEVVIRPVDLVVSTGGAYGGRNPLPLSGEDQLNRRTPTRSSSLQLFGGEVEICDGHQRTVMRIDPGGFTPEALPSAQSSAFSSVTGSNISGISSDSTSSSIVVTISKSGLNSGGGVVQVQNREPPPRPTPLPLNISFDCATSTSASGNEDRSSGVIVKSARNKAESDSLVLSMGVASSSSLPVNLKSQIHQVPYVPGIPGPYSLSNWLPHDSVTTVTAARAVYSSAGSHVTTTTSIKVPQITINPPCSSGGSPLPPEEVLEVAEETDVDGSDGGRSMKFLRPNSLPLKPGTFQLKKSSMAGLDVVGAPNMVGSGGGVTLISPETPRPRKLYRQTYLNGHAYTYLGLKCSTRVYYCCLSRSQPMYVIQCDPKLSMYSQWKTRPCAADSSPLGVGPVEAMSLYDSRHRPASFSTAQSRDGMRMILTHSSYWTNRDRPTSANVKPEVCTTPAPPVATVAPFQAEDDKSNVKPLVVIEPEKKVEQPEETKTETTAAPVPARPPDGQPKRVRIFAGGFKSNEDYTYVRGRGRGRYVCEECGIRCKKPSMLKKHIRTHTDLRPYTCRQCNFSFKTKGNLTKHMKSKAHHKKCTELGIVPVPTTVEEANIDEDSLARQETLKKLCGSKSDPDSELDDDDDDEDDEEDEDGEEEEEEVDFNDGTPEISGQFEDASETDARPEANRSVATAVRGEREQEVARSLLDLGVLAPAGSKPTTYPYVMHWNTPDSGKEVPPNGPEENKLMETSNDDKPFPIPEALPPLPQPPQPPPQQASGPMDLSTTRSVKENPPTPTVAISNEILSPVTQPSSLLASIYLTAQKVQEASVRRSLESPNESSETHSGMLQAYLTEKALKEGLMKSKQQIKEIAASGPSAAPITPAALASPQAEVKSSEARPNVIHPPSTSTNRSIFGESMTVSGVKGRPEVFVVPSTSSSTSSASSASSLGGASAYKLTDDGKTACSICNKVFTKPSQLRLHINIHYFERPFRCEACAVSFRTKGHLQKHKRSVTHFNKVNMNLTFGTPSSENPRPFKCSDCMIAFRIHGHLAKHLRSKMHIMKLECLGKLPFGTYAEMERSGINLNEIDTTDCHNSLESLQSLAHRLYKQDPSKLQQWQQEQAQGPAEANMRERTISGSSEEFSDAADMDDMDEDGEDSDGLPDAVVESIPHQTPHHPPQPPHQSYHHPTRKGEPDLSEPREPAYSIREEPAGRSEAHHHHLATSQPTQVSPPLHYTAPDPARAPPAVYCPACGEACSSNDAFQLHFMEKHRPLPAHPHSGPAPFAPSSAKEVIRSPSPMEASPQPVRPLELTRNSTGPPPDVRREIEYERSPPRPAEAKLAPNPPSHWNRNSEMASSYNQRPVYYHPGNGPPPPPAGLPPHSALSMWPRPPSGYGEFINPLSTMPPHWHQDPAAMAWIHHRLMMPMPPSGAPHPHNYMTSGHLAHGVNGTRLNQSPSTSNSSAVHSEELVFTCDICGKTCNSKDSLHQHMLAHAQPRPFVCEHCDAGFTTQQHLESHLVLHRPRTS